MIKRILEEKEGTVQQGGEVAENIGWRKEKYDVEEGGSRVEATGENSMRGSEKGNWKREREGEEGV